MDKTFVICVILLTCKFDDMCCMIYPSIPWTPKNPIFKENATLNVLSLSKILLVCPNPATVPILQHENVPKESLYENIWMVDKQGYETCTVNTNRKGNRLLKVCNKPLELLYLDIVFQFFSVSSSGLEFIPGREYYFISTADGSRSSLRKTSGGHCSTHKMKLKFYVCSNSDPRCQEPAQVQRTTSPAAAKVCPSPSFIYIPTCISKSSSRNSFITFDNSTLTLEATSKLVSTSFTARTSIPSSTSIYSSQISSSNVAGSFSFTVASNAAPVSALLSTLSFKVSQTSSVGTRNYETSSKFPQNNVSSSSYFNPSLSSKSSNIKKSKPSRLLNLFFSPSSRIKAVRSESLTSSAFHSKASTTLKCSSCLPNSSSLHASKNVNEKINVTTSTFSSKPKPLLPLAQNFIFPSKPIDSLDKVNSPTATQSLLFVKTTNNQQTSTIPFSAFTSSSKANSDSVNIKSIPSDFSLNYDSKHKHLSVNATSSRIAALGGPLQSTDSSKMPPHPVRSTDSSISFSMGVSIPKKAIRISSILGLAVSSSVVSNASSEVLSIYNNQESSLSVTTATNVVSETEHSSAFHVTQSQSKPFHTTAPFVSDSDTLNGLPTPNLKSLQASSFLHFRSSITSHYRAHKLHKPSNTERIFPSTTLSLFHSSPVHKPNSNVIAPQNHSSDSSSLNAKRKSAFINVSESSQTFSTPPALRSVYSPAVQALPTLTISKTTSTDTFNPTQTTIMYQNSAGKDSHSQKSLHSTFMSLQSPSTDSPITVLSNTDKLRTSAESGHFSSTSNFAKSSYLQKSLHSTPVSLLSSVDDIHVTTLSKTDKLGTGATTGSFPTTSRQHSNPTQTTTTGTFPTTSRQHSNPTQTADTVYQYSVNNSVSQKIPNSTPVSLQSPGISLGSTNGFKQTLPSRSASSSNAPSVFSGTFTLSTSKEIEDFNVSNTAPTATPSYTDALSYTQSHKSSLLNTTHLSTTELYSASSINSTTSSSIYDKSLLPTTAFITQPISVPTLTPSSDISNIGFSTFSTLLTPSWESTVSSPSLSSSSPSSSSAASSSSSSSLSSLSPSSSVLNSNNASVSTATPIAPAAGNINSPHCSEVLQDKTQLVATFLSSTDHQLKEMLQMMQSMSEWVKSLQSQLGNCSQAKTQTPTTAQPSPSNFPDKFDCSLRMDGHYSYPGHPAKYIVCDNGRTHVMSCPDPRMQWNQQIRQCDWTTRNTNHNRTSNLP